MGTITFLNGGPISWSSILGALSTCEAEVNAAVYAAKDALHLKRMLVDLGYESEERPHQIGEDNLACIAQAEAGLHHVRKAKHYKVRLRFLQQLCVDNHIEFIYTPTDLQLATGSPSLWRIQSLFTFAIWFFFHHLDSLVSFQCLLYGICWSSIFEASFMELAGFYFFSVLISAHFGYRFL